MIEFNPLRAHDTKLPPGAVFVIAHSLAEINKAASSHFNCRVMECRLAAKVMFMVMGKKSKHRATYLIGFFYVGAGQVAWNKSGFGDAFGRRPVLTQQDTTRNGFHRRALSPR